MELLQAINSTVRDLCINNHQKIDITGFVEVTGCL